MDIKVTAGTNWMKAVKSGGFPIFKYSRSLNEKGYPLKYGLKWPMVYIKHCGIIKNKITYEMIRFRIYLIYDSWTGKKYGEIYFLP